MRILLFLLALDRKAVAIGLLKLAQTFLFLIDAILDRLFGYKITEGFLSERQAAKEYESSAQIVDVVARAFFLIDINQPSQFLYRHNRYVHPDYILKNDNVLMMGVTPTHAFFSITNDPEKDLRKTHKMPFLYFTQCSYTEQLLMLPLSSFHRLADQLGDPKGRNVTVVDMSGRCGSTLLCQMLHRVPNVRSFSECWAFEHSQYFHRQGYFSLDQHKKNIQSIMRLLCKPEHDTKITHILIKMSPFTLANQIFTKELFPDFNFIFMTRNPKSIAFSFMKLALSMPNSSRFSSHIRNFFINNFVVPYDKNQQLWLDVLEKAKQLEYPGKLYPMVGWLFAASIDYFLQHRSTFDLAILYDDLVKDPTTQLKKIFKVMNLDEEFVSCTVEALKTDSQQGILGAKGNDHVMHKIQPMLKEINENMKSSVPQLNIDMSLEDMRKLLFE